jgi:hypothetical protein
VGKGPLAILHDAEQRSLDVRVRVARAQLERERQLAAGRLEIPVQRPIQPRHHRVGTRQALVMRQRRSGGLLRAGQRRLQREVAPDSGNRPSQPIQHPEPVREMVPTGAGLVHQHLTYHLHRFGSSQATSRSRDRQGPACINSGKS